MKHILFILFIFPLHLIYGQVTFMVDNFSPAYFGKIYISDTSEVFSEGWVAIYEKISNREVIKVEADELTFNIHDGQVLANIKELPYGEQSQIMYEDYNFDGKNDFAIMDGQNSCYHGPSFQIYLADSDSFEFSPDFTALAQEYCGMFRINSEEKKIYTMTKSGCCWHQFSEYSVDKNKPRATKIIVEDRMEYPYSTYLEEIWDGKKMVKSVHKTISLEEEGIIPVLTFDIDKKQKKIILFNINDRMLNYAVIDKNGHVEFSYPVETVYQNPDFTYNQKSRSLVFKNKEATYKIYDEADKIGIEIDVNGKIYNWTGNLSTKEGTLLDLLTTKLDNVIIE